MNMNVYCMHSYHMLFTTFASVLCRIYNISPSAAHVVNNTSHVHYVKQRLHTAITWTDFWLRCMATEMKSIAPVAALFLSWSRRRKTFGSGVI